MNYKNTKEWETYKFRGLIFSIVIGLSMGLYMIYGSPSVVFSMFGIIPSSVLFIKAFNDLRKVVHKRSNGGE